MKRTEALEVLAGTEALLVCNLGYPSRELYHIADRAGNFYMLGSMGLASSIGLGLALAQGRRVVAIDGDGSVLMNLGSLSTVAHFGTENFTLVILDNRVHGSTGNQPSHTALGTDLAAIAKACGLSRVRKVETVAALRQAAGDEGKGPKVVVAVVDPGNAEVPVIPIPPQEILRRFRTHLGTG
jgi:sulfopyruvate decarboxylase subunit beta